MTTSQARIALIGAGPRGLSVLDRLLVHLKETEPAPSVVITAIDDSYPGAGRIWRPDQPRWLTMNTTVGQTSIYSQAPVGQCYVYGRPSLLEWLADHKNPEYHAYGPNDFVPRAVYGEYLAEALRNLVASAPENVTIRVLQDTVTNLRRDGDAWTLTLAHGPATEVDTVLLATGHPRNVPTTEEQALRAAATRHHQVSYVAGDSPANLDLSGVAAGRPVLIRGLGLSFYDVMLGLTVGRGGTFKRDGDGTLRYQSCGAEPVIIAGSRGSVPFLARARNQKGIHGRHQPVVFTEEAVRRLQGEALVDRGTIQLDFGASVLPLIDAEVQFVYRRALVRERRGQTASELFESDFRVVLAAGADLAEILDRYGVAGDTLAWQALAKPFAGQSYASPEEFHGALLEFLRRDLAEAAKGNVDGAAKSAIDVLRDLRYVVRLAVNHGGLLPASHREDLVGHFNPVHAAIAAGPPRERVEQLVALLEEGVLRLVGADACFAFDEESADFTAYSPAVAGSTYHADVLIDARVPGPVFGSDSSSLRAGLVQAGHLTEYVLTDPDTGERYPTGGLRVSRPYFRVVDANGVALKSLHCLGIPTENIYWFTFVGMGRPGSADAFFRDADAVAESLLAPVRDHAEAVAIR